MVVKSLLICFSLSAIILLAAVFLVLGAKSEAKRRRELTIKANAISPTQWNRLIARRPQVQAFFQSLGFTSSSTPLTCVDGWTFLAERLLEGFLVRAGDYASVHSQLNLKGTRIEHTIRGEQIVFELTLRPAQKPYPTFSIVPREPKEDMSSLAIVPAHGSDEGWVEGRGPYSDLLTGVPTFDMNYILNYVHHVQPKSRFPNQKHVVEMQAGMNELINAVTGERMVSLLNPNSAAKMAVLGNTIVYKQRSFETPEDGEHFVKALQAAIVLAKRLHAVCGVRA